MNILRDRRVLSWCLFDFANSSYSAVIAAVIFPVYYTREIVGNASGSGDLWWGNAISVSMALVALTSPFIGGIADFGRSRKKFLILYTLLCIISVASFAVLKKGMVIEGFILIILANVGMEGGLVFYNSFLPRIAQPTHQGRISAYGFGAGYAGSIISLLIALMLVKQQMLPVTWIMVALFFLLFSLPAFIMLPGENKRSDYASRIAAGGLRNTVVTLKRIFSAKEQRRFLIAYLLYEDGINTVIVFSSIFAATTLHFRFDELIFLYLIVQGTALTGSFLLARPIDYWGPKKVVTLSLYIWTAVAIAAFLVQHKGEFMVIASLAGLGLGSVQAASRAFFAQFIPLGKESEYFGVYSLAGKSSAVIGPLLFGSLSSTFGSQRPAVLSVGLFFILGLLVLSRVRGGGPNSTISQK